MISNEARALAVKVLLRQRVARVLTERFEFTGKIRDKVRRSKVTLVVALAEKRNHDNVEFIKYVEHTMRGMGCSLVRTSGIHYYRGVKDRAENQERDPSGAP